MITPCRINTLNLTVEYFIVGEFFSRSILVDLQKMKIFILVDDNLKYEIQENKEQYFEMASRDIEKAKTLGLIKCNIMVDFYQNILF